MRLPISRPMLTASALSPNDTAVLKALILWTGDCKYQAWREESFKADGAQSIRLAIDGDWRNCPDNELSQIVRRLYIKGATYQRDYEKVKKRVFAAMHISKELVSDVAGEGRVRRISDLQTQTADLFDNEDRFHVESIRKAWRSHKTYAPLFAALCSLFPPPRRFQDWTFQLPGDPAELRTLLANAFYYRALLDQSKARCRSGPYLRKEDAFSICDDGELFIIGMRLRSRILKVVRPNLVQISQLEKAKINLLTRPHLPNIKKISRPPRPRLPNINNSVTQQLRRYATLYSLPKGTPRITQTFS